MGAPVLERATVLAKAKVKVAGAMSTATRRAIRPPLLAPPPLPPPPSMTHAEMLAARHESARAMDLLA